jgi:regulator of sigma E protease
MLTLITIGVVVLMLSVLVFVHEFGHFIVAKRTGVVVEEFAFGYPPRLLKYSQGEGKIVLDGQELVIGRKTDVSRKIEVGSRVVYEAEETEGGKFVVTHIAPVPEDTPAEPVSQGSNRAVAAVDYLQRGTEYTINLIPFGGYVRMLGEEDPQAPGSFASKSKRVRLLVLVAGAAMNLVLAVLIFGAAYMLGAPQVVATDNVMVSGVSSGSPAAAADLRVGDIVVSIDGIAVKSPEQMVQLTNAHRGEQVVLEIKRGSDTVQIPVTLRSDPPQGQGALGAMIQPAVSQITIKRYPFGESLLKGVEETFNVIALTVSVPILALRGLIPAELIRPIGPPGIVQQTASAVQASVETGWWFPVLNLVGLISTALAITNLLPLPALDGGRIFFIVVEAIRGRRVDPAREGFIHLVGLAILMVLMLVVSYYDIVQPMTSIDWTSLFKK